MNYLSIESISKSFGDRVLFTDVSFGLDKGQKAALVARNGTGKTTLLRMLAGMEVPDEGNITFRSDIKVGYLMQDPELNPEQTVLECVLHSDSPMVKAVKNYEDCMANPENSDALQSAMEDMDQYEAWDYSVRMRELLSKLSVDTMDRKIGKLSGGQQKRVALAKLLIEEPDFMVLDEPTNHLDMEMIEWLEEYLQAYTGALFMVTHDRYFLDRICTEIIEMEDQTTYRHRGNYGYYLENKEHREEVESTTREKAKSLLRTELEWMRRMPKARTTKSKARIGSFYEIKEAARKKRHDSDLHIDLNMTRLGSKILEIHHLRKSFDDKKLVEDFNYKFVKGEKIGIVGRNGTGKSTLLNMLLELEPPDGGKIVIGETVVVGYYTQEGIKIKEDKRIIEVVRDIAEYIPLNKGRKLTAADLLERFLFPRKQQYDVVAKLSGGEKRRLYLLTILMHNPNFLILDEPTNDLDILTLNVLEDFLLDFPGCLLIVTHDRYFMDKLVDHLFVFEGEGQIRDFPGNYTQYRDWEKDKAKSKKQIASGKEAPKVEKKTVQESKPKTEQPKKKISYKDKLEFETIEKEMPGLEKRKAELTEYMNSGPTDHEELLKKGAELSEIVEKLEAMEMRWLELSEFI